MKLDGKICITTGGAVASAMKWQNASPQPAQGGDRRYRPRRGEKAAASLGGELMGVNIDVTDLDAVQRGVSNVSKHMAGWTSSSPTPASRW